MLPKSLLMVLIGLSVASVTSAGQGYSSRTHFYSIEYLKPPVDSHLTNISMVFNRNLDPKTVEHFLREEMQRAIRLFPPNGDIMAYAFIETGPTGSDQMILLPDGSQFLIYWSNTKHTYTEKEYDKAKQKPPSGKGINIHISLQFERASDGRVRILGNTNLPDGMELMLKLPNPRSMYFSPEKVSVMAGKFSSAGFTDGRKPLPAGAYKITVTSPLPSFQPPAVQAIIGMSGENLLGPVSTSMGSKMVEYTVTMSLK